MVTIVMTLVATQLRCEYLVDPLGIDAVHPRLSWSVQSAERNQGQIAYRIMVASSASRLEAGDADLWDSGRVQSDQTTHVVYQGKPLTSGLRCWWKVMSRL